MRAKGAPCVRGEGRRRRHKKSSQPATSQEAAVRLCAACGAPHLLICSSEVITRSNLIPVFGFGLPWGIILIPQDVPCPCDI